MKKQMFERKGNVIRNVDTKSAETFKSVNLAKKASLKITKTNGLGSILVKK